MARDVSEDVEVPCVAAPRRHLDATERLGAELHRQRTRLVVTEPRNTETGTELSHRVRESAEILVVAGGDEIEIACGSRRPVGDGRTSADEHVPHPVLLERPEQPPGVKGQVRLRASLPLSGDAPRLGPPR